MRGRREWREGDEARGEKGSIEREEEEDEGERGGGGR